MSDQRNRFHEGGGTVQLYRRLNLGAVIVAHGGTAAVSALIDKPQSRVCDWRRSKPMGPQMARFIESKLGLSPGALDQTPGSSALTARVLGTPATQVANCLGVFAVAPAIGASIAGLMVQLGKSPTPAACDAAIEEVQRTLHYLVTSRRLIELPPDPPEAAEG